jgi:hypothetical protein
MLSERNPGESFISRLAPLEQRARQQEQDAQRLKSSLKDLEKDTQFVA